MISVKLIYLLFLLNRLLAINYKRYRVPRPSVSIDGKMNPTPCPIQYTDHSKVVGSEKTGFKYSLMLIKLES